MFAWLSCQSNPVADQTTRQRPLGKMRLGPTVKQTVVRFICSEKANEPTAWFLIYGVFSLIDRSKAVLIVVLVSNSVYYSVH